MPELSHKLLKNPMLVIVSQFGGALQHGVRCEVRLGRAAEFFVKFPEQLVLAGGGNNEVAGREHQVLRCARYLGLEKEHREPPTFPCRQ